MCGGGDDSTAAPHRGGQTSHVGFAAGIATGALSARALRISLSVIIPQMLHTRLSLPLMCAIDPLLHPILSKDATVPRMLDLDSKSK
jgi:hypothetical protein